MSELESTTNPFALNIQYHTIQGAFVQAVDARELHSRLGIVQKFWDWITYRIEHYGFVREIDYLVFLENQLNPSGGRTPNIYILTLDMAKELCMLERTDLGRQARKYFIDCEKGLASMHGLVVQKLEQFDTRLRALEEAKQPASRVDALTPKGQLPPPRPPVREHAEVSWHLASVWALLRDSGEVLTNREIAQRTGISESTAKQHTRYLRQLGMLDMHESFPRHLYLLSEQAENRNPGVYQRLQVVTRIIQERNRF